MDCLLYTLHYSNWLRIVLAAIHAVSGSDYYHTSNVTYIECALPIQAHGTDRLTKRFLQLVSLCVAFCYIACTDDTQH